MRGSRRGRKNGEWRMWRAPEQDTGPSEAVGWIGYGSNIWEGLVECSLGETKICSHFMIWFRVGLIPGQLAKQLMNENLSRR